MVGVLGFGVWDLGLGFGIWGLGFGVWGLGVGGWGVGCTGALQYESYLRLIHSCITPLKAQGPSRTCNESIKEVEEGCGVWGVLKRVHGSGFRVQGSGCGV